MRHCRTWEYLQSEKEFDSCIEAPPLCQNPLPSHSTSNPTELRDQFQRACNGLNQKLHKLRLQPNLLCPRPMARTHHRFLRLQQSRRQNPQRRPRGERRTRSLGTASSRGAMVAAVSFSARLFHPGRIHLAEALFGMMLGELELSA